MKPAACRRIGRTWNLSLQMDALNATLPHLGNGRQQSLRVGMITLLISLIVVRDLHHFPQIHNAYPVADLIDHIQVMGNEEVSQS